MSKENQAGVFIGVLANSLGKDRLVSRVIQRQEGKDRAEFFTQLCQFDLDHELQSIEPLARRHSPEPAHEQKCRKGRAPPARRPARKRH